MFLCSQAWISLLRLSEPRANKKIVLKVKCFREPLSGIQREPLSAGAVPGKGSRRDAPPTLESVSVETIQEMGEILIFADINGEDSQLVSSC